MGRNKMSSMRATLLCLGLIILLCLESHVSGKPKHFLIETEADSNDDAPLKLSGFEENPNNERPVSGSQETPGSDYCAISRCCPTRRTLVPTTCCYHCED